MLKLTKIMVVLLVLVVAGVMRVNGLGGECGIFVDKGATGSLRSAVVGELSRMSRLITTGSSVGGGVRRLFTGVGYSCRGMKLIGCSTFGRVNKGLDFSLTVLGKGSSNFMLGTIRDHRNYCACVGRVINKGSVVILTSRRRRTLGVTGRTGVPTRGWR